MGAISERINVGGATLSFHLKGLVHAKLLHARQEGRYIYYAANYPTMNDLLAYLTENCCQGQRCAVDCEPIAQAVRKRA